MPHIFGNECGAQASLSSRSGVRAADHIRANDDTGRHPLQATSPMAFPNVGAIYGLQSRQALGQQSAFSPRRR